MANIIVRPYLVSKVADREFKITIRHTRFNSQGYPLVDAEELDGSFPTATAARTFIRERYLAAPTDIATK